MKRKILLSLSTLAAASSVSAHEGHHEAGSVVANLAHLFGSADHLIGAALALLVVVGVVKLLVRRRKKSCCAE